MNNICFFNDLQGDVNQCSNVELYSSFIGIIFIVHVSGVLIITIISLILATISERIDDYIMDNAKPRHLLLWFFYIIYLPLKYLISKIKKMPRIIKILIGVALFRILWQINIMEIINKILN